MDDKLLKNYWFWVAAIVVGAVFIFYFRFDLPSAATQAGMTIYFENGETRKFAGPVESDMTILEALYSASVNNGFDFRYSIDKNGVLQIAKIGSAINFGNRSWHFYLNGRQVDTGNINNIKIKVGDSIEVKYE